MGIVDDLRGAKVCLDTAPFIYFIEKSPKYSPLVRPIFTEIAAGNIEAITSSVTLIEVLVHPCKTGNEALAQQYRDLLLYSDGLTTFEILHEVAGYAAKLRAKYMIRTPDAIQLAVGILYAADLFVTNDADLKRVRDVKVMVLDDHLGAA
ncbi:MAG: type II toxin-antitoxin system VapC family toxin [Deinococcota bacterium]|nr:type II toxin-antitoxin system VapC family toxin [Deinococcota bacterium]